MRRTGLLLRAIVLLVSGAALFAQSSGASSDAGLFIVKSGGEPERLHGVFAQPHPKNVAGTIAKSTLTFGLLGGAPKLEFVIDGPSATARVDASTSFLFRLTQQQPTAAQPPPNFNISDPTSLDPNAIFGGAFDTPPATAKKADDFVLARFTVMDGARHLEASQAKNGGMKTDASVATKTDKDKTAADTFTVQSKSPLEPGEYAFFYGGPGGGGQFWAFGVDAK